MTRTFSSLTAVILLSLSQLTAAQSPMKWKIHDLNRPLPPVIDPGTASTQDAPGRAPSDAVVLFDGKDLSHWVDGDGKPAKWKVENGYMEVAAETGNISSRDSFGDCQLHVEFAEPSPGKGESQERGNSGVFLMGLYEYSGARLVREQDLRRRPSLGCVRTISAAGECLAPSGTVADLRHHFSPPALQRRQGHSTRAGHRSA